MTVNSKNFKVKNGLDLSGPLGVNSPSVYGEAGQVLASQGSSLSPTWITVPGTTTPITYNISSSSDSGFLTDGAYLALTGSDASVDNVKFQKSGSVTITSLDANTIEIHSPYAFNLNSNSTLDPYPISIANSNSIIEINNDKKIDLTIPSNGNVPFPIGTRLDVVQTGSGGVDLKLGKDLATVNTSWTSVVTNLGVYDDVNAIGYGNGVWLAGGYYGKMRSSTDAITWVTRNYVPSGFSNGWQMHIYAIAYGNNLWVAGGYYGNIKTSTDTITWTTQTSNFTNNWSGTIKAISYGNNLWIAGGYYGQLRTSTDAITWVTRISNFSNTYNSISSIEYLNGLWVAGGHYGDIRVSNDGITWITRTSTFSTTENISSIGYGNGKYITASVNGKIQYSIDGTNTWTSIVDYPGDSIYDIAYGNNLWVAAAGPNYRLLTSINGTLWVTSLSITPQRAYAVEFGDGKFVIGGKQGKINYSTIGAQNLEVVSIVSKDNEKYLVNQYESISLYKEAENIWVARKNNNNILTINQKTDNYTIQTPDIKEIIEVNSSISKTVTVPTNSRTKFPVGSSLDVVQIGTGSVAIAGETIQPLELWTDATTYYYSYSSLKYANNIWVAGTSSSITTSTDTITWTTSSHGLSSTNDTTIDYGNGLWLIGNGYGYISRSTDLLTWITQTNSAWSGIALRKVLYANSLWIGVGSSGYIKTSTDTVTWTSRVGPGSPELRSVDYGNSLWVVAGLSGNIKTSTDTVTWTSRVSNFGTTHILSVAFGDNIWVAGGNSGQIRISTDAITWTTSTSNFGTTAIFSIAYGNGAWVAGGYNGTLRSSTDAITWVTRISNFNDAGSRILGISYGNNIWAAAGYSGIKKSSALSETSSIVARGGDLSLSSQYQSFNLYKQSENVWVATKNAISSTTYAISAETVTGGASLRLTGSDTTTDDVKIQGSGIVTVTRTDADTITINGSVTGKNVIQQTTSYTPALADANDIIEINSTSAATVTIPSNASVAYPIGTELDIVQTGVGNLTLNPGTEPVLVADGTTWITQNSNYGVQTITSLAYGNNTWVAGGYSGKIVTSTDTITWTTRTSNFITNSSIWSITFGNNLWLATGSSGQIRTSTDAITWITQTNNFGSEPIFSSQYSNSLWLAGGYYGSIRTSTDTITWVTGNLGTNQTFRALTYANNLWVIGTNSGNIRTSTDTVSWTSQDPSFSGLPIFSIAYGNNLWVAGGYYGKLSISTDTITWITRTSNFTSAINSIVYANTLWVGVSSSGEIRTSTDTITWVTQNSSFGNANIYKVIYQNNILMAAGANGQIRTSNDVYEQFPVVSILAKNNSLSLSSQYESFKVYKEATNTWVARKQTDTNTTYAVSAETVTGGASLRLTGSDTTTDDVKIQGSGIVTVTRTDVNTVTIDGVVSTNLLFNEELASYTIVLADKDLMVEMNVASANILTIPTNAVQPFPIGSQINVMQTGIGQTTISGNGGVTVNGTPGLKLRAQWSAVTLIKRAINTWVVVGDLSA